MGVIHTCILLGLVCYTSNYDVQTAFGRILIYVHTKQPHSAGVQEESVAVCANSMNEITVQVTVGIQHHTHTTVEY